MRLRGGMAFGASILIFAACGSEKGGFVPEPGGGVDAGTPDAEGPGPIGTEDGGKFGNTDGGGGSGIPELPSGQTKDPATCAEAQQTKSYVGCDYWPTVVANNVWSNFDFAAVVANAGQTAADVTITAGHAFGGDHEAVNVPSALLAAKHVAGADVAIVAMGPGVVGTGTKLGYSAAEVAPILDAAGRLGGRPVAALRFSQADRRERHRGVSHHTRTALALAGPTSVAVPRGRWEEQVRADLAGLDHEVVLADDVDVPSLLDRLGLQVTTMGRGPADDPGFYAVAGAAGTVAAGFLGP